MKTTVNLPDKAVRDLMKFARAAAKNAAILQAINVFDQRHRMARIARLAGTLKEFMTQAELSRMREARV